MRASADLVSPERAYGAELGGQDAVARGDGGAGGGAGRGARNWWVHGAAIGVAVLVAAGVLVGMAVWSRSTGDEVVPAKGGGPAAVEATSAVLEATGTVTAPEDEEQDAATGDSGADEGESVEGLDTDAPPTPEQVSPSSGAIVGSSATLEWDAVRDPSGVSYIVEIQIWDADSQSYVSDASVEVVSTDYERSLSARAERWRLRALDGSGNKSAFSGWRTYGRLRAIPMETETTVTPQSGPD